MRRRMTGGQTVTTGSRTGGNPIPDPHAVAFIPNPKAKLRDQVHEAMRFFHYSRRTEIAHWGWIMRFLKFHRQSTMGAPTPHPSPLLARKGEEGPWRHPRDMGVAEVAEFLSHLAMERDVAAATQNQALNALVFLYQVILRQPLGDLGEWARVQRPARLPTVLTAEEVGRVLAVVAADYQLPVRLIYGSGLRLPDLARLRVKDLSLERRQIVVRDGKGRKDRVTMVPETLAQALHEQLLRPRMIYEADRRQSIAGVWPQRRFTRT